MPMLIASGCYVTLYLFKPLSVVFGMNSPLQTHEWNTCVTVVLFSSDGFQQSVRNNLSPYWFIDTHNAKDKYCG